MRSGPPGRPPARSGRAWGYLDPDSSELVDGTRITVPRCVFSFREYGWGVENYGVDPDIEVLISPDDWGRGP